MKKTIYILAVIALIFGACDKIDEPYLEPLAEGGENKATITIDFMGELMGAYNLNIFIIEDGVISPQKNDLASIGPEPDWIDYEHNHLLRQSLTGGFGIDLVEDPTTGTQVTKEVSFGLDSTWVSDKLSLLIFITDENTKEIIQAGEAHLSEGGVKSAGKVVLLEEFTGHTCVNCPEATLLARGLKETYGEQLLLLAVHAGDLAEPKDAPYDADLRTSAGNDIYNEFAPLGVPAGMVNRTEYSSSVVLWKDSWEGAVQARIAEPQMASINISIELAE